MTRLSVVNGLRALWMAVILWYELLTFFSSVRSCQWPDSALPQSQKRPAHVLIIADPQILDHRSYPNRPALLAYISRVLVDLNVRKNWYAATHKKPEVVVCLGDMMDGGRFAMPDEEYEQYYARFMKIFRISKSTPVYFIPGNHDIGLRASDLFSPHAYSRYTSHFGSLNYRIELANHTLVFINAPGLVEEDIDRQSQGRSFRDFNPTPHGTVEFIKSVSHNGTSGKVVLFSHIPLHRNNPDCGPLREKGTIRPGIGFGYQNTLSQDASNFLLENIHPSTVFSGDDHDYCVTSHFLPGHETSVVPEVTVRSLSMAMGIKRPGFQLLSLANSDDNSSASVTIADLPCLLPDQLNIYLSIYVPFLLVSLIVVLVSVVRTGPLREKHRLVRRSSSAKLPRKLFHVSHRRPSRNSDSDGDGARELLPHPSTSTTSSRQQRDMCKQWRFSCRRLTLLKKPVFAKRRRGVLSNFVRDVEEVAIFPLGLFCVINLWMTFDRYLQHSAKRKLTCAPNPVFFMQGHGGVLKHIQYK